MDGKNYGLGSWHPAFRLWRRILISYCLNNQWWKWYLKCVEFIPTTTTSINFFVYSSAEMTLVYSFDTERRQQLNFTEADFYSSALSPLTCWVLYHSEKKYINNKTINLQASLSFVASLREIGGHLYMLFQGVQESLCQRGWHYVAVANKWRHDCDNIYDCLLFQENV